MIRYRFFLVLLFVSLASVAGPRNVSAEEPTLTFFGWSDQHVQTNGDGDHLLPAIDALNELPGRPFPESIGGTGRKAGLRVRLWRCNRVADACGGRHVRKAAHHAFAVASLRHSGES